MPSLKDRSCWLVAVAWMALAGGGGHAQTVSPGRAPVAPPPPSAPSQLEINIAWQVALEAADFSPGVIDGVFKRKGLMALSEFTARHYPGQNAFDPQVYPLVRDALKVDFGNAVVPYTVTADDAAQVGGPLSDDWNEKARKSKLDYETLADCLTEKFHCTRALLEQLNPGVRMDALAPGVVLKVPNIRPFPADNRVTLTKRANETGHVTVNLGEKTIRVYDREGRQLALFHCSIAKDKAKLPNRDTKVSAIAAPYPGYKFDPAMWPEVHNVYRILQIPPGPRNPVGLAWCSLDLPGYGIHGTPKPELIGKTGSHGCFRLTNWDALKFASLVKEGTVVRVVNPDRETARGE